MVRSRLDSERPTGKPAQPRQGPAPLQVCSKLIARLTDKRDRQMFVILACALLLWEAVLTAVIIRQVSYTEIDWIAYMQEVEGFLQGERDYSKLRGDTGPLVYPAGFVYLFWGLKVITQGNVFPAQIVFAALYLASQAVVFAIYGLAGVAPPWTLLLLTLSKRMHSLFVLRLFNDCWAMLAAWLGLLLLCRRSWAAAIVTLSAAVSIKMNVLLMAPPVFAICLAAAPRRPVIIGVLLGAALQVALAVPFLLENAHSYFGAAFEFSRVFMYKWTVNWKMLPEDVFLAPWFAKGLLAIHVGLLLVFMQRKWLAQQDGIIPAFIKFLKDDERSGLQAGRVALIVFSGNFIGILCARSLHYQFYSWYFHSVPLLLWSVQVPTWLRLAIFATIEVCWNVFPATAMSSSALVTCHAFILLCMWLNHVQPSKSCKEQ